MLSEKQIVGSRCHISVLIFSPLQNLKAIRCELQGALMLGLTLMQSCEVNLSYSLLSKRFDLKSKVNLFTEQ